MRIQDISHGKQAASTFDRSRYSYRVPAAKVTLSENDEPLVPLSQQQNARIVAEPFWETPGDIEGEGYAAYIAAHPSFELAVRASVYERLIVALEQLPDDWTFVVKAGFRPYAVQLALLDIFIAESRTRHPDWSDDAHLEHARTFVTDPRIVVPPHTTGGAIDLLLRERVTGEDIDMGSAVNEDSERSFLHSDEITPEQRANRYTLLNAMLAAGFAPNVYEWWHYQYGETYWAAFYGQDTTQYSILQV